MNFEFILENKYLWKMFHKFEKGRLNRCCINTKYKYQVVKVSPGGSFFLGSVASTLAVSLSPAPSLHAPLAPHPLASRPLAPHSLALSLSLTPLAPSSLTPCSLPRGWGLAKRIRPMSLTEAPRLPKAYETPKASWDPRDLGRLRGWGGVRG